MERLKAWLRAVRAVNPLITDGAMAMAVLLVSLPSGGDDPRINIDFREPDTLGYLLVAAQCLPVAIRRIRPDFALPISGIGIGIYSALGYQVTVSWLGVLICLYSIAAHAPRPIALYGLAWTMVGMAFSLLGSPASLTLEELFGNYVISSPRGCSETGCARGGRIPPSWRPGPRCWNASRRTTLEGR
ncbi:MAG TPA: hypothetical protein VFF07_08330 [Actinomycetota bacterium]|nr:hypothetical protein [Actinomycetota bacterium]